MIKITKQESTKLQINFPLILKENLHDAVESGQYADVRTLSIFDHWLSEHEASKEVMSYSDVNSFNKDIYDVRESILQKCIEDFLMLEQFFIFIEDENDDTGEYYSIESDNELSNLLISGIREEKSFCILLPTMEVIISTAFDMTFDFYFVSSGGQSAIQSIAKDNGLFLIV